MENKDNLQSMDERRLVLEENRLKSETRIKEMELELKKNELEILIKKESQGKSSSFSPLTTAIIGGVLGLIGTAVGIYFQGSQNLELEKNKFEFSKQIELQKQKHELIIKMIGTGETEQAAKNLLFLVNSGLIEDSLHFISKLANETKNIPVLPSENSSYRSLSQEDQVQLIGRVASSNKKISDSARDVFIANGHTTDYILLNLIEQAIENKDNLHALKNTLKILEQYGPYTGRRVYEVAFSALFSKLKNINDIEVIERLEKLRKKIKSSQLNTK